VCIIVTFFFLVAAAMYSRSFGEFLAVVMVTHLFVSELDDAIITRLFPERILKISQQLAKL